MGRIEAFKGLESRVAALERAPAERKSTIEAGNPAGFGRDVAASDTPTQVQHGSPMSPGTEEIASTLKKCMYAAVEKRIKDPEKKSARA